MKKKLLVLSIDCLHGQDLARGLQYMPALSGLIERGTMIQAVTSVYPTITYAAHASMMTGCQPRRTKIIANELYTINEAYPPWHWWERDNHATPLYALAKQAGWKVGLAHWPVSAGAELDINMAEIWAPTPMGDTLKSYLEAGCNAAREEEIFKRHQLFYSWRNHPPFDMFAHAAARDMLREDKVDAMFVHSAYLDAAHHRQGNGGDAALEAMQREDEWLGALLAEVQANGDMDNTFIAILSDHGSIDYSQVFHPNALFLTEGFARLENGRVTDVRAWAFSGGGCCLVHVPKAEDVEPTRALLERAAQDARYGIDYIKPATDAFGYQPEDASLVIEMKEGWAVTGEYRKGPLSACDTAATHGYLPEKGPQPVAVFAGPGVAKGKKVPKGHLCDLAPTIAQWMGIAMDADGRPLDIFA